MTDFLKNLAIAPIASAPSPPTSGGSLDVDAGLGGRFPTPPFQATIFPRPSSSDPYATPANAEIVTVTAVASDTLSITRAQEGTTARAVAVGDLISATLTKQTLEDTVASAMWELALDLPLVSGTSWGMPAGWTNDGTKHIVGVNTPQTRNWYSVRVPQSGFMSEVKIQLPSSSRSASDQRAGILLNGDGSTAGAALYVLRWNAKASATMYVERDTATAGPNLTISGGLALDTWHTLRIIRNGIVAAVYVNGVYIATSRIDAYAGSSFEHSFLGLYGYQIDAWFKDLKVWVPSQP